MVYRPPPPPPPPNSDINMINVNMSELFITINSDRNYISCLGDYNISLLNNDTHGPTQEFAYLMYSHALFPCITKQTKSASFIYNIFCKNNVNDDNVLMVSNTQTYQTTFRFFILITRVLQKTPCSYLKKNAFFPSKVLINVFEFHNGIM